MRAIHYKEQPAIGDLPPNWSDLAHRLTFGRLTFIGCASDRNRHGQKRVVCFCACGNYVKVMAAALRAGTTTSCGCVHAESVRQNNYAKATHGHSRGKKVTPTYRAWAAMNNRCYKPNDARYADYGAKGVEVCDAWRLDFSAFLADVGERPEGRYSLDRIDPNGNYEPGNVRWATPEEQNRNKRATKRYEFRGARLTVSEIAERANMPYELIHARVVKQRWTTEEAVALRPDAPLDRDRLRQRWYALIARCTDRRHPRWKDYGGRGVGVCERWRVSFEAFEVDVGYPPTVNYSIDRIDNDKGYEPGNVRWATFLEQNRNRRNSKLFALNGVSKPLSEWCAMAGVPYATVKRRLHAGWPLDEALGTPPGNTGRAMDGTRKKWVMGC
jgi:hypothetical protein